MFDNYALLDAFKKQSIKECTYLPEDIRIQIIKLLQQGLNKYDSTDLYELFDLAEQKLITLAEETKIINAQRKLSSTPGSLDETQVL